jgi:hypothetical protein
VAVRPPILSASSGTERTLVSIPSKSILRLSVLAAVLSFAALGFFSFSLGGRLGRAVGDDGIRFHLVALRRERILHVLAQGEREDSRGPIRGEIEFDVGQEGLVFAIAQEIQIVSLGVPRGVVFGKGLPGHPPHFAVASTPDVDRQLVVEEPAC